MLIWLAWAAWLGWCSYTAPRVREPLPWVEVIPSLSRDGSVVAFAASRAAVAQGRAFGPRSEGESTDVLVWDGKSVRSLGPGRDPSVSADGSSVVFVSGGDLWLHGRGLRRVASGASLPALSGERVAWVSERAVYLDGRVLPGGPVYGRPALDGTSVAWSCYGRGIVLWSDGRVETVAEWPAFSPALAGGVCAWVSPRDGVVVRDLSSAVSMRIGQGFEPSLSEDGRWLAWSTDEGVWLRDLSSARTTWVGRGYNPCVSGDGRFVAFASRDGGGQVFLWSAGTLQQVPVR